MMRHASVESAVRPNEPGFVLELDGRPVLALAARSLTAAKKLCAAAWFVDELMQLQSGGEPVLRAGAISRIRRVRPDEAIELRAALVREKADGSHEGFVFAFLIPIDLRPN